MAHPDVRQRVAPAQVEGSELREAGEVAQPDVRHLFAAAEVERGELREAGQVNRSSEGIRPLALGTPYEAEWRYAVGPLVRNAPVNLDPPARHSSSTHGTHTYRKKQRKSRLLLNRNFTRVQQEKFL